MLQYRPIRNVVDMLSPRYLRIAGRVDTTSSLAFARPFESPPDQTYEIVTQAVAKDILFVNS